MSTKIKRLYQNGEAFVPITMAEAVVVNCKNVQGLSSEEITTLDKVLYKYWGNIASNADAVSTINKALTTINNTLASKQDKLTAGYGINISDSGEISVSLDTTGLTYKVVDVLPTASADCMNIIYLVANASGVEGNLFTEYICVYKDNKYSYEQIGTVSSTVDLSNYVTLDQLHAYALTASDVTTSAGAAVSVTYDIPSTLYDSVTT